jgi:hypothetical protein
MDYIVNEVLIKQYVDFRPRYCMILESDSSQEIISFEGMGFKKNVRDEINQIGYSALNEYGRNSKKMPMRLISIKHDWDIFFFQFENGDIFQLYFMMDSEESPQQLLIFRPTQTGYALAVDRLNKCEDWSFH